MPSRYVSWPNATRRLQCRAYLLHDASFALRKGDMPTRLVLNELDFNLPSLTARLVIIVIVVVGGSAGALTLVASGFNGTILKVILLRIVWNNVVGHLITQSKSGVLQLGLALWVGQDVEQPKREWLF